MMYNQLSSKLKILVCCYKPCELPNSKETKDSITKYGIDGSNVIIFHNAAPSSFFKIPPKAIPDLKYLLIVSNHIAQELYGIISLLENMGIKVSILGQGNRVERLTPTHIEEADAVITIGKTTQYALAGNRPVYCYDHFGGPGWLTLENYEHSAEKNYSGRCCNRKTSSEQIFKELITGFSKAHNDVKYIREASLIKYNLETYVEELLVNVNSKSERVVDFVDAKFSCLMNTEKKISVLIRHEYCFNRTTSRILEDVKRALEEAKYDLSQRERALIAAIRSIKMYSPRFLHRLVWFVTKALWWGVTPWRIPERIRSRKRKKTEASSSKQSKQKQKTIHPPKFGVSYVVFDGEELLERSLACIQAHVDYINIVYSPDSYYGDPGNPELPAMLDALKTKELINEIIVFKQTKPVAKGDRDAKKILEIEKRNLGLSAARTAGCDYFMSVDTDEFYDPAAVEKAKAKIIDQGITHSFVHILNYGRLPTQLSNIRKWEYFVPFFSRIIPSSKLGEEAHAPCICDPTRIPSHFEGAKYYVLEDIFMHHYTRVRRNLAAKYATRQVTDAVDADWLDKEGGFIEVPDYFSLGGILN